MRAPPHHSFLGPGLDSPTLRGLRRYVTESADVRSSAETAGEPTKSLALPEENASLRPIPRGRSALGLAFRGPDLKKNPAGLRQMGQARWSNDPARPIVVDLALSARWGDAAALCPHSDRW